MSQPPYPSYGQSDPNESGGYQPPSYPPVSGGSYGAPQQGGSYGSPQQGGSYGSPQPGGSYGGYQEPAPGGYGPPAGGGYPPPGQSPYGAPPPKKKGGALKIVLIVIGVVLLLCIGGGVFAYFKTKDTVENVVAASKITVVAPATLAGRDKISDPQLQGSIDSLDGEMKNIGGTTSSVAAIYGDLKKQDAVMVAAASTLTGTQQSRFDQFSEGLNSGGFSTKNLADTDPGPLGGIAKCGDSSIAGTKTAVCIWSDQGSVGMIAMLFKSKASLVKEFVTMRGQVEKKA